MGWCHEFGVQIRPECGHPMSAEEASCACPECGVVCTGRFEGCQDVWARGPRPPQMLYDVTTMTPPNKPTVGDEAPEEPVVLEASSRPVVAVAGALGGAEADAEEVADLRAQVDELNARLDAQEAAQAARAEHPAQRPSNGDGTIAGMTELDERLAEVEAALTRSESRLEAVEKAPPDDALRKEIQRVLSEMGRWVTERVGAVEAQANAVRSGPDAALRTELERVSVHQDDLGEWAASQFSELEGHLGSLLAAAAALEGLGHEVERVGAIVGSHRHEDTAALGNGLGHLEGRLDTLERRFGPIEARLGPVEARAARLEDLRRPLEQVADLYSGGAWAPERTAKIEAAVHRLLEVVDVVSADLGATRSDLAHISQRLEARNGSGPEAADAPEAP